MEFNNTSKRYNQYSAHLKNKFGAKVYKVTLDAGFSCPNRDGTLSSGGCIFCDDGGSFSRAHSNLLTIEEQVNIGIETLKNRFKAEKFMSYFQAFSNTYKPVNELEKIYSSALNHPDIVGLSIGTRPDCIDDEKLKLISSYKDDYYTWIEYGLQSIHDKTLEKINRGHDFDCFLKAYEKTKSYGINVCVHVIFGLWESHEEIMQTAQKLAELKVDGVKIHMLCALKNTKLSKMYENGEINFMEEDEYVKTVCDFLEYLPPDCTIHRLAGNGDRENLIAPKWLGKKMDCLNKIDREFLNRNTYQSYKFY
ncbi:TIGR01212 family radical SAM protein [bacterium]|nr:TIGR01212 family radical SAM protein [bacterium]